MGARWQGLAHGERKGGGVKEDQGERGMEEGGPGGRGG